MSFIKKYGVRILAGLLVLALLLGLLAMLPLGAEASPAGRKSYTIAIVLDNSGSMYKTEAWCQAKYAVEIFASMLDYSAGDELWLFPMWEVTTDASSTTGGSYAPIKVGSKADIDKISNMYTTNPNNTPFAPVEEAHSFLKGRNTDEKWLIVMTDGGFNQRARKQQAGINLQGELLSMASNEIKVQYIGFGSATAVSPNTASGLYVSSENGSLQNRLIDTCNLIFQRNVLPADRLQGDKLNIDISTKNLVVFAQGADARVTGLKDSSGADVQMVMDSGQRKYSTISTIPSYPSPVDSSLAGQVVTFAACAKGEYTLSYSGVDKDKIRIFYEPDVELKVSMVDADGQPVDMTSGELIAGDYRVQAQLLDRVTGEDVSNHPLMGNVKIQTYVKPSGAGQAVPYPNGSAITLDPDQQTEIFVQADYLDKYSISTKDDKNTFPLDWKIFPQLQFEVKAQVQQPENWYKLSDHDNWKPVKVTMTIDGQPLTAEQLQSTTFSFSTDPELLIRQEDLGNGEHLLHIARNENGEYVEPDCGKYTLQAKGSHTDENGRTFNRTAEVTFDIQWYDPFWIPVFYTLLGLLIAFLIWRFLTHKCFPGSVTVHKQTHGGFEEEGEFQIVSSAFTLEYEGFEILTADAVKVTPFYKRNKANARIKLENIQVGANVHNLRISGVQIPQHETTVTLSDSDLVVLERGANHVEKRFEIGINR